MSVAEFLERSRKVAVHGIRRHAAGRRSERGGELYELMLDYPLRPAKGLRPALCLAACTALGGHAEAAAPSMAALELYHNAFLVHDDIEDGSELRRQRPTLHQLHGVPVALNVGDGMLALALEPLLENTEVVGLARTLRILRTFSRMARETAEGQMLELGWIRDARWDLGPDDYLVMVEKKTAWYSFVAPCRAGAQAAGAAAEAVDGLDAYALALGRAFQIVDDLLNLEGDVASMGKEACGDLWEGKRTLMLLDLVARLEGPERQRAVHALGGERAERSLDEVLWLRGAMEHHGCLARARAVAAAEAGSARAALEALELPDSDGHDFLEALVDYVVERTR